MISDNCPLAAGARLGAEVATRTHMAKPGAVGNMVQAFLLLGGAIVGIMAAGGTAIAAKPLSQVFSQTRKTQAGLVRRVRTAGFSGLQESETVTERHSPGRSGVLRQNFKSRDTEGKVVSRLRTWSWLNEENSESNHLSEQQRDGLWEWSAKLHQQGKRTEKRGTGRLPAAHLNLLPQNGRSGGEPAR
jgi:hypothetical protein